MDRFKRFRVYARAWATGDVQAETPDEYIVAAAIGVRDGRDGPVLKTIQDLDVTIDSLGISVEENDEPDGDAEDRDARQLADAQARLAKLVDARGGSLCYAAADEIVRLRMALSTAEHVLKYPEIGTTRAHLGAGRTEATEDAARRVAGELQQAKEALEQARTKVIGLQTDADRQRVDLEQAHQTIQAMNAERDELYDALEIRSGETLLEAAQRAAGGAAEMRDRAAAWCDAEAKRKDKRGQHLEASALWHAYQEIRALSLSAEPQTDPGEGSPHRPDMADARCAATARALLAMGIPAARAEAAVRIAEEEGGAAPETAHSAVLRLAKREGVAWFNSVHPGSLRAHIEAVCKSAPAAHLSAEDAETLRGVGWREEPDGRWRSPIGAVFDPSRPHGLLLLQGLARDIRSKAPPAADMGPPGKGSGGEENAASGKDSVPEEQVEKQGRPRCVGCGSPLGTDENPHPCAFANRDAALPKPPRVEVGQRWLTPAGLELDVTAVDQDRAVYLKGEGVRYAGSSEAELLDGYAWTFLGTAPAPQGPKRDGDPEEPRDAAAARDYMLSEPGARHPEKTQVLHSESAGVRLAMPKDADPRAVLATVAELLGLPSEEERERGVADDAAEMQWPRAAVERLEQSAVQREAKIADMAAELEHRPVPQVSELAEAAIDVMTDYLDVPDEKMLRLRGDLQRRLRGELTGREPAASRLYPITPGPLQALAGRIEHAIVEAFSQPSDGERRGPGVAREVLRLVDEHLRVTAEATTQKPAAVAIGQRWTCVGVEGELVVREIVTFTGRDPDIGLSPDGSYPSTVHGREADMLGLAEWSFLSPPA